MSGPKERFWEKAALVHEQNVRPGGAALAARQARHLYDLGRLWNAINTGNGFRGLWDGVVTHRKTYFDYKWVDYASLTPGKLRLIPPDVRLAEWQADYGAMREMFYSDPPPFGQILASLRMIQEAIAKL